MMVEMFEDPIRVLAQLIVRVLTGSVTASVGPFGVKITGPFVSQSIDERLQKIELARQSLSDALEAVESLRKSAEENKRDLSDITGAIEKAQLQKRGVSEELEALKGIAAMESVAVRKALKLPNAVDLWRERIIAFLFGIGASVLATVVWEILLKRLFFGS